MSVHRGKDDMDYQSTHLEKVSTNKSLAQVDITNSQAYKGDDSDGKVDWTARKVVVACVLSMLYTGSQLILYFVGGSLSFIATDLQAPSAIGWLPVANTLAIGAICPFVGYAQDLLGKRYIAIVGAVLLCVGSIVLSTANTLGQAIAGMVLSGIGAGIGELTGLAGLAETLPLKHRGYSSAIVSAFVLPFAPYVLYSELFSEHSSWRWAGRIPLIYNGIALIGLVAFYNPKSHNLAEGVHWRKIVAQIDYIGACLSIAGLTLFLVGLQSGGYTHPWTSAFVLCPLIIGIVCIVAWIIWEIRFARHPMIPKELFQGQNTVALAFGVAFVGGMNFYSLLNFWPLTIKNVWNPQVIRVGLRGFAGAMAVAAGAIVISVLLSLWRTGSRYLLFIAATILTAFGGALTVMTPENEIMSVAFGVLASFGVGGLIVPSATVAMTAAPDQLLTTCAALSLSVRAVGGSVGYSIFYAIFQPKLIARLPTSVATYAIEAGLPPSEARAFVGTYLELGAAKAAQLPGVTLAILDAALLGSQWAYADSLRYLWYTTIAFGCLAMVAAAFIPSLTRYATNRIAVTL